MRKILLSIAFILILIEVKTQEKPFIEEEVSYWNTKDSIKIGGTLTVPKFGTNFRAAIIITGSGTQDRNGTIFGHTIYKNIAEYLSSNGIAVLRLDDRGAGKTTGKNSESTAENLVLDVKAGINFLKNRKEIHPKKIGLIGHSEGGTIAPMVASETKDVAFIVSMAGTAVEGLKLLVKQNYDILKAQKIDTNTISKYLQYFFQPTAETILKEKDKKIMVENGRKFIENYKNSVSTDEYHKIIPAVYSDSAFVNLFVNQINHPSFRYFLSLDPSPFWRKVKCPVLALNGTKDLQVDAEINLNAIENHLKIAKNKKSKIVRIENHNHLFQPAKTGTLSEYSQKTDTPSLETLKIIMDWLGGFRHLL